jgi:hypothetical protein
MRKKADEETQNEKGQKIDAQRSAREQIWEMQVDETVSVPPTLCICLPISVVSAKKYKKDTGREMKRGRKPHYPYHCP